MPSRRNVRVARSASGLRLPAAPPASGIVARRLARRWRRPLPLLPHAVAVLQIPPHELLEARHAAELEHPVHTATPILSFGVAYKWGGRLRTA